MSVTITLFEIGVLVIAVAAVVAAVALSRFTARVTRTAEEVNQTLRQLTPRVDRTLEALQSVTRNVDGITQQADRVMGTVADTAVPLIRDVEQLRRGKKYVVAAAKGVQAGVRTWNRKQETKGAIHE